MNAEVIRALTPIFLATVGGVFGAAVLLSPNMDATKAASGMGLAGTAIAGAAGLAQTGKNESKFSVKEEGGDVQVQGSTGQPTK